MTPPGPIRVMLVDDHDMVRRGLTAFLLAYDDLALAGEASSGEQAVHLCEQLRPDVVLMDLVMPGMDGATATRAIREHCPEIQIIALTSFKEKELVEGALEAGAIGYLLKNISADKLADAIRAAQAGRSTLAPEATRALAQAEKLEQLARAIIDSPPDASVLPGLLLAHVPGMLQDCQVEIKTFPDQVLLRHPVDGPQAPAAVWEWLRSSSGAHAFLPGTELPWGNWPLDCHGLVAAPINSVGATTLVGGILVLATQAQEGVSELLPAVRALSAQISSALHSAQVHTQTLVRQRVARELAMAGQIQASFLPSQLPDVVGWEFAATLEPARETSGDFYDFIPLPDGRLGILVADVADKGIAAALYMALCHTLIRTYAAEHHTRPELVLGAANRRVLADARANWFVTVFYGILDPKNRTLTYCNAGHNAPLLFRVNHDHAVHLLSPTGMALGVVEEAVWQQSVVELDAGDALVLYTDGVTEAQNTQRAFFGEERLLEIARSALSASPSSGASASGLRDALVGGVRDFVGDAPQADDITLVVVVRNPVRSSGVAKG